MKLGTVGDFAEAVAFYRKALSSAEQTDSVKQICVAGTLVLERTSDATGFDGSVSLASRVRKLAVRSGDAHLSVSTHLTFGRLEGKAGHFDVARRHFGIARKVLLREPNAWLLAATDLDESSVLSLCGDVIGAIELAKSGGASADESGWSRGRVAAAATLAFCYLSIGNFADAEVQFSRIERERFNSPSYRLALADTKARAALAAGDWTRAEEILDSCSSELNSVQRWYRLDGSTYAGTSAVSTTAIRGRSRLVGTRNLGSGECARRTTHRGISVIESGSADWCQRHTR